MQAALDLLGVPYALSGPLASALAMDKAAAKRLLRGAGVPTPDWLLVDGGAPSGAGEGGLGLDHVRERAGDELGYPLVAKPNAFGSSVGVRIVAAPAEFDDAFAAAAAGGRDVLLETFVPGRELTAAIFMGQRLPLVEIRPRVFDLFGCRGLARVDFRLDGDTYSCLEVNTIPGMTANSLVPKAAAAVGIGFADLLEDLCRDALDRAAPRNN